VNLHLYPRASSRACRTRISTHLRVTRANLCDNGNGYRLIWAIDLANTEEKECRNGAQGPDRTRPRSSIAPKLPSIKAFSIRRGSSNSSRRSARSRTVPPRSEVGLVRIPLLPRPRSWRHRGYYPIRLRRAVIRLSWLALP
jgi:hypothetical protein